MKRGKPLERKTPLKASRVAMKQGRKLPAMSAERRSEQAERAKVIAIVKERDQGCVAAASVPHVACRAPLDVHEPLPRSRGGDYLDPDQCIAVCRAHHTWAHTHPLEAKPLGLIR